MLFIRTFISSYAIVSHFFQPSEPFIIPDLPLYGEAEKPLTCIDCKTPRKLVFRICGQGPVKVGANVTI
jgi:hypothetical protein